MMAWIMDGPDVSPADAHQLGNQDKTMIAFLPFTHPP